MIYGIGTDIIEVERIEKACQNERFLEKNFTPEEIKYFNQKTNPYQSIAAVFAAKEAFSKAFGTGFRGFTLKDIEILHNQAGKPYINLYNNIKDLSKDFVIHLSLSHIKEYATAYVVIEK